MAKSNPLILTGEKDGQQVRICLEDVDAIEGMTRRCPKCCKVKPLSAFGLRRVSKTLTREQSWCLDCR